MGSKATDRGGPHLRAPRVQAALSALWLVGVLVALGLMALGHVRLGGWLAFGCFVAAMAQRVWVRTFGVSRG
ncbi:MAG: hypothetical protein Q8Q02_01170 [Nocardioides sp.]|nr:hypothetical protein [Nocardioides sp.]